MDKFTHMRRMVPKSHRLAKIPTDKSKNSDPHHKSSIH